MYNYLSKSEIIPTRQADPRYSRKQQTSSAGAIEVTYRFTLGRLIRSNSFPRVIITVRYRLDSPLRTRKMVHSIFLFGSAALVAMVRADRTITFINNCGQPLKPQCVQVDTPAE